MPGLFEKTNWNGKHFYLYWTCVSYENV